MSHNNTNNNNNNSDTVPLHPSSQSDIDEIENLLISSAVHSTVLPAKPPSPTQSRPSIPVSSSPFISSHLPRAPLRRAPAPAPAHRQFDSHCRQRLRVSPQHAHGAGLGHGQAGPGEDRQQFEAGGVSQPVSRGPREGAQGLGSLGAILLHCVSGAHPVLSEVFAVAFALLAAGAIILTLNVLLLGGHIIFFQSLSLLGYCLFPLDIGALICMLKDNVIVKVVVVCVTLAWSSWAAYPFMSAAVNPRRKALALYPVFLMYISVGFLIIAID
ncbi:hypothetical protein Scep_011765 [Stephania cephalantha]|uniref:Protein YIP n=1 Tax=Stephania cephalantha TaxID=152367 RepID=A0AAP0JDP4_9MAGN